MTRIMLCLLIALAALGATGCSGEKDESAGVAELRVYPVDDMEGLVMSVPNMAFDRDISSDGKGSLRIEAGSGERTVVYLYETGDLDVEETTIFYQARMRCEGVSGQAFLEMWVHFAGQGEFFSRNLQAPLAGTTNWTLSETPFILKKGQNPDNIKLNVVIEGSGTVWIDDIRLIRGARR